jgi:outer membrane protein TolC
MEEFMRKYFIFMMVFLITVSLLVSTEGEQKELSLKDAIYHALKNNLDLQVQMTDTELSRKALKINKSIFIPAMSVETTTAETNEPGEGILSGADVIKSTFKYLSVGVTQRIPFGGTVNFRLYNQESESNSIWANPNPRLYSRATLSLNQPLLKNFGLTATKREIYIAANNLKIAKHQLRENIITLVYNVEEAYWNLVYAYQNLEATKTALKRAQDLLKQNEIKVRVGSAAPIEILTAKADVASNESLVIQAERSIQTAEERLKRILNMSKDLSSIVPTDTPEIKKIPVDFNDFLLVALNNRPDMERAKLDLENYKIRVKYAKNQFLPDLQLSAMYFTTGRGGTEFDYLRDPLRDPDYNPDTDKVILADKSIWGSMDDVFSLLYKNYQIQLSLSMPLSFSREKAELAQARINLKRALLSLKNVESTVHSEVKEVMKELEANAKLVEADKIALELQGERLKAEEKRLSVGLSTNFIVLDYQRQYASAQTQALRSIIDYTMTLARINRILARTFNVYDIKLADFIEE